MTIPSIKEIEVFLMLKYGQNLTVDYYSAEISRDLIYRIIIPAEKKLTGYRFAKVLGWSRMDEDHTWEDAYRREITGRIEITGFKQ